MKIELTIPELFDLTGRAEIQQLKSDLATVISDIGLFNVGVGALTKRLAHHEALFDILEMRTGGQARFFSDGKLPLGAKYQPTMGAESER